VLALRTARIDEERAEREAKLLDKPKAAPPVALADLDPQLPAGVDTVRRAAEYLYRKGGRITITKGVVVIHAHPIDVRGTSAWHGQAHLRAVISYLYSASSILAAAGKGRDVTLTTSQVPDVRILPGGQELP